MMSAKEQTQMWQQNSYLGDSGIHSGTSSQVPSLSGKEEIDLFDLDNRRFTQSHDDIGQNGVPSVQATIFSDPMDDTIQISSPGFPQCMPETPEMKPAVNFMDYQNDSDVVTHAIPQLIKFLGDEDQVSGGTIMQNLFVLQLSLGCGVSSCINGTTAFQKRVIATGNHEQPRIDGSPC